jgi:hypothetical protein
MAKRNRSLRAALLAGTVLAAVPTVAAEVTPQRLLNPDKEPQNWLMNHRPYDGRRFSPLAGINLHTWTGFGSVTYWNAYVAATEMHGAGTYFDARLNNAAQFPVAARSGSWNTRGTPDQITGKLAALHFYQLAIPAPKPPTGSFAVQAALQIPAPEPV